MEKLELIERIRTLSELLHHSDIAKFAFTEETLEEMRQRLDEITEQYIESYC